MKTIGILALQGDYSKHREVVDKAGLKSLFIRTDQELEHCDALIIPGGESTTLLNLIEQLGLRDPLISFAQKQPVLGTCAGLIILAKKVDRLEFNPLGLIDLSVRRNAYGRQINSFVANINLRLNNIEESFEGVFIRAPKIEAYHGNVRPLAYHEKDVVLARNENILVATFHPELTDDLRIHQYFFANF